MVLTPNHHKEIRLRIFIEVFVVGNEALKLGENKVL
jgi:hypothetical protein